MDRSERFYKIERLLKAGPPVPFARLQDELGVSRAQLKRDLAYMRERFNAPIEYDRGENGYRFGKPGAGPTFQLPGLWFSSDELHALVTMQHLLANLQPGLLAPHIKPLLDRIASILGSGAHSSKEVEKRVRVLQIEARAMEHESFGAVARALLDRRRLAVLHYHRLEDRRTERTISPQRLVHYRDNWYVDAWCHLREGLRSFAVDAIERAEIQDEKARDVPDADLDAFLKSGYGIFTGSDVTWAKLRFSPAAARWVARQVWHGRQRGAFDEQGRYVLELPYADDRELVMDVQKFGPEVEVLAPEGLRAKVAAALAKAAEQYA